MGRIKMKYLTKIQAVYDKGVSSPVNQRLKTDAELRRYLEKGWRSKSKEIARKLATYTADALGAGAMDKIRTQLTDQYKIPTEQVDYALWTTLYSQILKDSYNLKNTRLFYDMLEKNT